MTGNQKEPLKDTSAKDFLFRETALDGASFARDFLPAFFIMAVALGLSVWLPVEADTGLRPVESSLLVIVGSLAAISWIVARRLRRLKRRTLAISSDAIRVYPPRGLLALSGDQGVPQLAIPAEQVVEVISSILDSIGGRLVRRKTGIALSRCEVRTDDGVHFFDDMRWRPDIDTMARLERYSTAGAKRKRMDRALEAALRMSGYPVRED